VRRSLVVIGVTLLFVYLGVSISPLPERMARHDPELASYFRPPWFNFNANYSSGRVLNFSVGEDRADFIAALKRQFGGEGILLANCGTGARFSTAASFIPVSDSARAKVVLERDVVCVHFRERKVVLLASFSKDKVRAIELSCIHSEGT
jgi:hypothetical protein